MMNVLAAAAENPKGALLFLGFLVLVASVYGRDLIKAPFVSCRCRGGRIPSAFRSGAFGVHRACEGKGVRPRRW